MYAIQRLIKDQNRADRRNRRGKRGRDDAWVSYLDNEADYGTINRDMEDRRWSRFGGDCSPNTVDELTSPPVLPPMERRGKLSAF